MVGLEYCALLLSQMYQKTRPLKRIHVPVKLLFPMVSGLTGCLAVVWCWAQTSRTFGLWLGLILRHSLDQLSFDVRDCLLTPGLEFIVGLRSEQRALHTVILGNHFRVRPLCKTKCNINKRWLPGFQTAQFLYGTTIVFIDISTVRRLDRTQWSCTGFHGDIHI